MNELSQKMRHFIGTRSNYCPKDSKKLSND